MDRLKPGCYLKAKVGTCRLNKGEVYEVESVSLKRGFIKLKGIPATYEPEEFTFWSPPDYPRTVVADMDYRSVLTKGHRYEVRDVEEYKYQVITNEGHTEWLYKSRFVEPRDWKKEFTAVKQSMDKGVDEMRGNATSTSGEWKTANAPEDWRDYEFEIRHEEQIDDDLIRKDLSAQNPLMIAEVEGSTQVRVYIWQGLWTKVFNCKGSKRLRKELDMIIWANELWPSVVERSELPRLIKVLKRIKQAQWKKGNQAKVTVRKLKV